MSSPVRTRGRLRALASAIRIPQWTKNLLIVVAPAASGTLFHRDVLVHTGVTFAIFCAVASALYLLNDLADVTNDRTHPTKKFRAIAAGELSIGLAVGAVVLLLAVGVALLFTIARPQQLIVVVGLYILEVLLYSYYFKNVAVIELAFVASGFFLRAYAGAAASHIPVSNWFLIVVSFGALFLVIGKRSAELRHSGGVTRRVLDSYTPEFLHSALTLAATVVVTAYCLWAVDTSSTGLSSVKHATVPTRLSVIPVVLSVLVIIKGAESPQGESPEDLVLKNRVIQVLALIWCALLAVGIYA